MLALLRSPGILLFFGPEIVSEVIHGLGHVLDDQLRTADPLTRTTPWKTLPYHKAPPVSGRKA